MHAGLMRQTNWKCMFPKSINRDVFLVGQV
jgi:hypothetical protein